MSGILEGSSKRTASRRVAKMSVIGANSANSACTSIVSFIPVLFYRFYLMCTLECASIPCFRCCRVHIHPSLGSPSAFTSPNILTSRSCILILCSIHISCCCRPWVFKQSWRRTRRRTALRIMLVDDSCITRVSPESYRGRAGHKWQERRRRSGKREPPVA